MTARDRAICVPVNWLLLPDDERVLLAFIIDEIGGVLLDGEVTEHGEPRVVSDPLHALSDSLPSRDSHEPTGYTFWIRDLGEIRTMADAPRTSDAREMVFRQLNADKFPDRWRDLVDLSRSPVLRVHRSNWNRNGCLNPGLLQAAATTVKEQPPELLARLRKTDRWLRREGERLNPFDYCSQSPMAAPRNMNPFWVWARPHALAWVQNGGEVWPWNA
jgi:hypothetical protein